MGPYQEIAIFRRLGSLTMLNLMSLQAELVALEVKIWNAGMADDESQNPDSRAYSTDFSALHNAKAPND